jgi:hypothetical protein
MADTPSAAAVVDSLGPLHKFLDRANLPREVLALQQEEAKESSDATTTRGEACVLLVSALRLLDGSNRIESSVGESS